MSKRKDVKYAREMADRITATMRREDKREDGRDVIYKVANQLCATPRLCPNCNQSTLYPVTWLEEVNNPNRVLMLACIRCSEAVFEGHHEDGRVENLGRGNATG